MCASIREKDDDEEEDNFYTNSYLGQKKGEEMA